MSLKDETNKKVKKGKDPQDSDAPAGSQNPG